MNAEQQQHLTKIRKLIGSDDPDWVQQGLELLDALEDPALWAVLAAGLSVDGEGNVVIPEDSEVRATVAGAHRVGVALWALNRTGRLQEVTSLDLNGCMSLENVDGLKGCTNLTSLSLRGCESLENVDGLKGCTDLTTLNLSGCKSLQNVDGLKGCTNLTDLSLWGCSSLQDVDGLEGCTNLKILNLRECRSLQNVDVLEGCTNLKTLYLGSGTFTALQSRGALGVLKSLPNLTILYLSKCSSLQNVDVLKGCTNLTRLILNGCESLENVDGLKGCTNLTSLDLSRCTSLQGIAPKYYSGAATIRALFSRP